MERRKGEGPLHAPPLPSLLSLAPRRRRSSRGCRRPRGHGRPDHPRAASGPSSARTSPASAGRSLARKTARSRATSSGRTTGCPPSSGAIRSRTTATPIPTSRSSRSTATAPTRASSRRALRRSGGSSPPCRSRVRSVCRRHRHPPRPRVPRSHALRTRHRRPRPYRQRCERPHPRLAVC